MDTLRATTYITPMMEELDATGLLCPLPVLKARKRLLSLPSGAALVIRTDDPAAIVDVPHFCNEAGHALENSQEDGDAMIWTIRKA
ncbi:sulfurtransferase TusA family protein [Marivita hallyeonensis]|uniref:tRNA 2-thiouridine synthesizing protein A n=1 Tax=Marivita hallyeonensis TaxID=996342 RepID=A0A1M5VXV1_9RHOB|nr:sulfurtransferase TusA family protein [Marivita hallyeonensis]SHH79824.1 tRNA 2-thiouridine synthesizing protein A [Marivita hallyeonensis]